MRRPSFFLTAILTLTLLLIGAVSVEAQSKDGLPQPQSKEVTTKDGFPIHFTYWPSQMGKESPVVILLHGKGQNRVVWNASKLLNELLKLQFAVVSVDLRKHGDSVLAEGTGAKSTKSATLTKFDYEAMIAMDLEAVKHFLFEENQAQRLNMKKIAVVSSDMSTVVALNWTALDWAKTPYDDAPTLAAKTPRGQDVQAVVLISPMDSLSGVGTTKTVPFLRQAGIAALVMCGTKKSGDKRVADKMFQQLGGDQQDKENPRIYAIDFPIQSSGLELLARQDQSNLATINFLKKHLMDAKIDWRDRKSRLE